MGCAKSKLESNSTPSSSDTNRSINTKANMFLVAENGLIGEGGFGKVLAAMLVTNKKWYAVKEINKCELLKHRSGLQMLHGEMDAHRRMDHSFIVSLHMTFQDTNNCFIALDLKTGGDLRYYLRKKLLFEERDVAFYVACLSSALDHIHSKNVIHRDIKPENIILDERGFPHLADFGVAHVQSPDAAAEPYLSSNLASGTKQYLAPEVFTRSHLHGPESDFWALAVVAYELLYGKRPFEKHCNVQFINYLERGLSLKRKQQKEKMLKELSSTGGSTSSTDADSTVSPCPSPLPLSHSSRTPLTINPLASPSASSLSPGVSPCQSKDSHQLFFPAIKQGVSSGSMDSYDPPTFCSSVCLTPGSTMSATGSRKGFFNGRNAAGANGIASPSRDSSKGSIAACSEDFDNTPAHDTAHSELRVLHGSKSCSLLPLLPLGSPQRPSAAASMMELPPCMTPPRPKFSRAAEGSPGIAARDSMSASDGMKMQQQQHQYSNMTTEEGTPDSSKDSISADEDDILLNTDGSRRLRAGDHWLVDDDYILPHELRVHIPVNNVWLGRMTPACVSFLRRMFDIRPSHRLSSRDIDAIRSHSWLVQNDVSNWDDLEQRKFSPAFKPGKRFMRDTFDDFTNAMLVGNQLQDSPLCDLSAAWAVADSAAAADEEPEISAEQNALFKFFDYIAPQHKSMFGSQAPCLRSVEDFVTFANAKAEALQQQQCGATAAGGVPTIAKTKPRCSSH